MRRTLGRVAWLLARLLLVLALIFSVLSTATHSTQSNWQSDRIEQLQLPRFFNGSPVDLSNRVSKLVQVLSRSENDVVRQELLRLGGAAFPLLGPRMGELQPGARAKIAWAYLPALRRMGFRGTAEVTTPEQAPAFLERAWHERSADYQPAIVRRWVERLAQRENPTLRASVIEYDTYALPALMAAMPEVATESDVESARRLTEVASRVTGLPWIVQAGASPPAAATMVAKWREWWALHSTDYIVLRGPSRWSAMLSETQFGKWMVLALRFGFGHRIDGPSIGRDLLRCGATTLSLIAATTVGSWLATLLPWSFLSRTRNPKRHRGYEYVGQAIASIPAIALAVGVAGLVGTKGTLTTATITAITVALMSAVANHFATSGAGGVDLVRTQAELDRRSQSPLLRLLRQWPLAGHRWPYTLLLVFVIERAAGVHALAALTVAAFLRRDLHSLMAITTLTASWLLLVEFVVQSRRRLHSLKRARRVTSAEAGPV
ncbi:MAG: hypothetical protein QM784_12420 [Polyangiaceae bacterium]